MSGQQDGTFHLTTSIVLEIHSEAVALFGGCTGVRDRAMLESAVAAPQASAGGKPIFTDLIEIAAAYLFYICRNHPFTDGNKRAGLGACIVFLRLNGVTTPPDSVGLEDLTMAVANGELDRDETTARLRSLLASAGAV